MTTKLHRLRIFLCDRCLKAELICYPDLRNRHLIRVEGVSCVCPQRPFCGLAQVRAENGLLSADLSARPLPAAICYLAHCKCAPGAEGVSFRCRQMACPQRPFCELMQVHSQNVPICYLDLRNRHLISVEGVSCVCPQRPFCELAQVHAENGLLSADMSAKPLPAAICYRSAQWALRYLLP